MPASRTTSKATPRANASPYKTRSRAAAAEAATSNVSYSPNTAVDAAIVEQSHIAGPSHTTTAPAPGAAKARERCTKEQAAALEELYLLTNGRPTAEQVKKIAEDLNKKISATYIWYQNRRSKASRGKNVRVDQPLGHPVPKEHVELSLQEMLEQEEMIQAGTSIPAVAPEAVSPRVRKKRRTTAGKKAKEALIPDRLPAKSTRNTRSGATASAPAGAQAASSPRKTRTRRHAPAPGPTPGPGAVHSSGASNGSGSLAVNGLESDPSIPDHFTTVDLEASRIMASIMRQYSQPATRRQMAGSEGI